MSAKEQKPAIFAERAQGVHHQPGVGVTNPHGGGDPANADNHRRQQRARDRPVDDLLRRREGDQLRLPRHDRVLRPSLRRFLPLPIARPVAHLRRRKDQSGGQDMGRRHCQLLPSALAAVGALLRATRAIGCLACHGIPIAADRGASALNPQAALDDYALHARPQYGNGLIVLHIHFGISSDTVCARIRCWSIDDVIHAAVSLGLLGGQR